MLVLSSCRNGLLTEHNILEVNGQNVVGLKVRCIYARYLCSGVGGGGVEKPKCFDEMLLPQNPSNDIENFLVS